MIKRMILGGIAPVTMVFSALISAEDSFVVILLYPVDGQKTSSKSIDYIRGEYMRRHRQESVLRVDDPFLVWVSFWYRIRF